MVSNDIMRNYDVFMRISHMRKAGDQSKCTWSNFGLCRINFGKMSNEPIKVIEVGDSGTVEKNNTSEDENVEVIEVGDSGTVENDNTPEDDSDPPKKFDYIEPDVSVKSPGKVKICRFSPQS